ncbi:MAG: 1-acyl-sn-glycerol-3-phosphate acyltransferase [Clostridia bacterium]|nr:1-acyl-sn-glycerol-3-phosphate acyltransferase [Clostridia bacterium]
MKKTRYYSSFEDDFTTNAGQDYTIPESYKYIRGTGFFTNALYYFIALLGAIYLKLHLHLKIVGKEKIKKGENYFIFGNHTQPIGDVFLPALISFPKRFFAIVSPANLGIPILGKLLPFIGAIPLPSSLKAMPRFASALHQRFSEGYPIAVYPEAHVWEYMKDVRPFSDGSFQFPIKENAPVYSFTSTYQKRRFLKRPRMTVFIDGPFYPDNALSSRQSRADLHRRVYNTMTQRAGLSDIEYIAYRPMEKKTF